MARRKQQHKIDKKMIIDAFTEMAKEKKIDKDLLQGIIEEILSLIVKRKYGNHSDFEIVVNMQKGDIEIYLIKQVVEIVENTQTEISLEEANMYSAEPLKIGDDFIEEITLDNIADSFGRRLVAFASQMMNQKVRDVERDNLYQDYSEKQNELIVGEIYQKRQNLMIVMHNGIEMKLLKSDQIPDDARIFKKNKPIKAIIKEVKRTLNGTPEIYLSRTSDEFVKRLFELEIPEVNDKVIQIKAIAREPGERMKISLQSSTEKIDPIGACVGLKGIRINAITKELSNESIDLIPYSDDINQMIARSLAPAKVKEIHISPETKTATVIVSEEQITVAIGKFGLNVRLASALTGFDIKILKEGGEDIEIIEFQTELGSDIIQKLQELNVVTARDFLDVSPKVLLEECGMSYDSILEIRRIMLLEFEERENQEYIEQLNSLVGNSSDDTVEVVSSDENKTVANIQTEETVEEQITVAQVDTVEEMNEKIEQNKENYDY